MMILRVLLAEDSYIVRQGLERILSTEAEIQVVGSCGDMDELMRSLELAAPDVVVTDIRMPPSGTDEGLRVAAWLRESGSDIGVVVLSQYVEPGYARALLEGGAQGRAYLLKDNVAHGGQLVHAVREVARGGCVVDPQVVDALMAAKDRLVQSRLRDLTPRERDVLRLLAEGRSNVGIAEGLGISASAVEKHVNAIFSKLELVDQTGTHRRVRAALLHLAEPA
jgi:DNA-binding NarL/FixJ family response regulator